MDGDCVHTPNGCNDGDPCTDDACVDGNCVHTPKTCDDGNPCTENDHCDPATGGCRSDPKDCRDGDPCTIDRCDPHTGECVHTAKDFDDGNPCTVNDHCDSDTGRCVNDPKDCEDAYDCTKDSCDPQTGACEHTPAAGAAARLKRLAFAQKQTVIQDYGEAYSGPDWQDDNDDGDASDAGEHRFPVAYRIGQYGRIASVEFVVCPPVFPAGSTIVRGTDSLGSVYDTDQVSIDGDVLTATDLLATEPFPWEVRYFGPDTGNPYVISWEVSGDGGETWYAAGASDNRLFLLLYSPSGPYSTLYETVAWISCRGAAGATTPAQVYLGSWSQFTGLAVRRKPMDGYNLLDSAALYYWATLSPNQTLGDLLKDRIAWHDGSCCAWAQFLIACGNVHGVSSDYVMVTPNLTVNPGANGFLVKSWIFLTPSGSGRFPYLIDTDVLKGDGLPGQNNDEPVLQDFARHFVARRMGDIYDPSYGAGPFVSENDHENAAIDGIGSGAWAKENDPWQELLYTP